MWSKQQIRYDIVQVELGEPVREIALTPKASGVALVFRMHDEPVGFLMEAHKPGTRLIPQQVAARAIQTAGQQILANKIRKHLAPPQPAVSAPVLDIAICTRNRTRELKRCLESLNTLLEKSPGTVRVLVVDNAPSDDQTEELVASFPNCVYLLEPVLGLDLARNRAVYESSADLLAFLDDDVVVDRCWLQGIFEAWAANPDAACFTGPILPLELETRAQVVFERMGGFGKSFERIRYGRALGDSPLYPVGAGLFGAGANMVFRPGALRQIGGFDDVLDTGAPLPGGGDLDIFYRLIRAGYVIVREPKLLVYHQHRRTDAQLRRQMWTWGTGTMAYLRKSWMDDPEARPRIRRWVLWWSGFQLSRIFAPFLRRNKVRVPASLVLAELMGALVGICGGYERSAGRMTKIKRQIYEQLDGSVHRIKRTAAGA